MGEPEIERRLVERARNGDVAAYGRLVGVTEASVRAAVRREIRDPGLAEDAVQETYLRAFRSLGGLRDAGAFSAWIRRIAVTTARNELRRRRLTFVDPDSLPDLREPPGRDGPIRAALAGALVRLPAADRRLLERYYRGRWPTSRLAREDGVSEAAVRKRIQRARDRLREDITVSMATDGRGDLPARIVELLGRPILIDLPESPVGAVWEEVRATRPDDLEIDLDEMVAVGGMERVFGPDPVPRLFPRTHRVDEEQILRFDLTVPMLLAARGRPIGSRLLYAGKVYRDEAEDSRHLQTFHQAELLWIGPDVTEWDLMAWFADALEAVLPGHGLRIDQVEYPVYAGSRSGYEVHLRDGDVWRDIAGFARIDDDVVAALGFDPAATAMVSLGMGLERMACLKYGIDDVRQVEARRIDE